MENFKDIELTEEEQAEAILWRKQRKKAEIEQRAYSERAAENRKKLTGTRWDFNQTESFMLYRAATLFPDGRFTLDTQNQIVFRLLCLYFSEDPRFVSEGRAAGLSEPSLTKGILLAGSFGVGKTWLMKLFQKNQRQVFYVRNAKDIADAYQKNGADASEEYENLFINLVNDANLFFQTHTGLCIDDLGAEDIKKHFGNHRNVIGDLIELRYARGFTGTLLHATTNFTSDQIQEYYGSRVRSRMREIFNLVELKGNDRRK